MTELQVRQEFVRRFSRRLVQARRRSGTSQDQLGVLMGVTRGTISRWEHGQQVPDIYQAWQLKQFMDAAVVAAAHIAQVAQIARVAQEPQAA